MIEPCEVGQRLILNRVFRRWQNVFCSRILNENDNESYSVLCVSGETL
jgi:hypothetical protein